MKIPQLIDVMPAIAPRLRKQPKVLKREACHVHHCCFVTAS